MKFLCIYIRNSILPKHFVLLLTSNFFPTKKSVVKQHLPTRFAYSIYYFKHHFRFRARGTLHDFRMQGLGGYIVDDVTFNILRLALGVQTTIPRLTFTGMCVIIHR